MHTRHTHTLRISTRIPPVLTNIHTYETCACEMSHEHARRYYIYSMCV